MMRKIYSTETIIKRKIIFSFCALILCLVALEPVFSQRFIHPSIPFTRYDLDMLKQNISVEPWLSAYNDFKNDNHSKLTYSPQGPQQTVTRAPNLNNTKWQQDMIAIHHLAFMWIFTGDSSYARKATDLLDAWAVTNTVWGGSESMLDIGDYAQYWATAADILRGTFPNWTSANTDHVKNYFANVLYPTSYVPYQLRDANKGALQLKIALGASAFLDDSAKFKDAIDVYRMDAGGGMRNSLTNGETGDAGRDDHWRVQVAALVWGAEVAYKQGIDMYAELGNRVFAIGELYHKYAFIGNTLTFIPFGGYASFWTNWGIRPGARAGDYTNILKAAYALRKGIPTPWTDSMRSALGGAGGDFLYLKSSDTSTAAMLPQVVYPGDNVLPATVLTNLDIGNTGMAGSASYSNGTWTLKGAGNSLSTAMNYTFKKMTGNSAVVVKVTGMSLGTAGSGVMIRQSLAGGAQYWNIELESAGGVGPHYQPKAPWWLKIERVGNRIFTYHSPDGANWTSLSCYYTTTGIQDSLYYGFYTISNNTSALNTATFTNVAFNKDTPLGAPDITSNTAATAVINSDFTYNTVATGSPTNYTATGLPSGLKIDNLTGIISGKPTALGTFIITVTATNASGGATGVLILKVSNSTAPAAPTALTALVVNTSNIKLTWTASANATTYSVKRSFSAGGPYTNIADAITATTYTDILPQPEAPNYYIVTALSGSLESGISNQASASVPPSIPDKPRITILNRSLKLDWDTASGAASYNVKRSGNLGGPYTTIANVVAPTFTDTPVINGSPYYYVVSSVGKTQQSGNSAESFGVPGSNSLTWDPSPLTENWGDSTNWLERIVPSSPAIVTFKETDDSTLNNNISNLSVSRILFDTAAVAYTISGNTIVMGNDIVNTSSSQEIINAPLFLNNDMTVYAKTSNIVLGGIISGSGSFRRVGGAAVYVSGNNTYSGNTTLSGSAGTWPPSYGLVVAGNGTGTSGSPTSGPLGTGRIIMSGGALYAEGGDATLYNDIEISSGITSRFFQTTNALNLKGHLTGDGTIYQDGNTYAGLHLFGDNSGFTGKFVCVFRSGNNRLRFEVPESGSANAYWNLDANGIDCQSLQFASGTISFGALTGRGYFRNNGGGAPVMSIGALNMSTTFQGTINGTIGVEKVGTANLEFTGNHTYGSPTTIRNGRFLLDNSPTTGVFNSAINVIAGYFGGVGLSSSSVTVGTGSGTGATLEPGNLSIGTFTTTGALALNTDATYALEVNSTAGTADKIKSNGVTLNNPVLSVADLSPGAYAPGTSLTIIDNSSSTAISGTFKNLPELALIKISGVDFRITYKGGTGNDAVLMDNRTLPSLITSSDSATAFYNKPFNFTVTAVNSPTRYSASGLPAGLAIDSSTGIISGIATAIGVYAVTLSTTNVNGTASSVLNLTVQGIIVANLFVAAGDGRDTLTWDPMPNVTFNIKRSTTFGGPYTLLKNSAANTFLDNNVVNGTVYYYVVSSIDSFGENANSSQVSASPNQGQVGYYRFDETSGTKELDWWGGKSGALFSSAVTRVAGKLNNAISFNGTSTSYATLPTGVVSGLNDFTAAVWVRMSSLSTWMRAFDFGNSATQYMFLTPQAGTSGTASTVRYAIKNGSAAEQNVSFNYVFPLNTWVHLAVTQSGNTATLYINGTQVAANMAVTIKPSALGSTALNYLGKSQFSDPMFNGAMDELKLYSRALSAAEVNALVSSTVLPISFLSVDAVHRNLATEVDWKMADETGIGRYEVERSSDGVAFGTVGTVMPALLKGSYRWTDNAPSVGSTFYRIKGVGASGSVVYSAVVNVYSGSLTVGIGIYPNPVMGSEVRLHFANMAQGDYSLVVIDYLGRAVARTLIMHPGGSADYSMALGHGLARGLYSIQVTGGPKPESIRIMLR